MRYAFAFLLCLGSCHAQPAASPKPQKIALEAVRMPLEDDPGQSIATHSGPALAASGPALQVAFSETREDQITLATSPKTKAPVIHQISIMDKRVRAALEPLLAKNCKPTPQQVQKAIVELTTLRTYLSVEIARAQGS